MAKEQGNQPSMFKPGTTEVDPKLAAEQAAQRIREQMAATRERDRANEGRLDKAREEAAQRGKQHSP